MVSVIESRVFATGRQLDPCSADTIWLVSDEFVRQFRNADLGAAAKLNSVWLSTLSILVTNDVFM